MNAFLLLTLLVAPCLGGRLPYVIGGVEVTDATKYPFMVSLQRGVNNICGGAIISDRWIATAAHCVAGRIDYIVTGRLSVTDDTAGNPVYYDPMGYLRHEQYEANDATGYPNDIAVVKSAQTIVLGDTAAVIPLGVDGDSFTNCVIMGWGHTQSGILPGDTPDRLQEASVTIFTQDFCAGRWSPEQISEKNVCAGITDLVGACTSDGGGPLACEANGVTTLAGVFSFTQFTCGPGVPSVYTRVSSYNDWILDIITPPAQ